MKVLIRYRDNRVDIFDTNAFTKAEPFSGTNMLTNFEVRFDKLGQTGLWLTAHRYETNPTYREEADESEIPVAHRKKGWRFLLADKHEVDLIEHVEVDGLAMLTRVMGELVDMMRLDQKCGAWAPHMVGHGIAEKVVAVFEEISKPLSLEGMTEDQIARECGCTYELVTKLYCLGGGQSSEEPEEEEQAWLEEVGNDFID